VRYGSSILPARHLRFGGQEFKDDAFFLASGCREAGRLIEKCGITPESRILDVGCGVGRLPIGILSHLENPPQYWGVDVDTDSINSCTRYIARHQSRFHFERINVLNRRYNPSGVRLDASFRLPYGDSSFDLVYLYSIFPHMLPEDLQAYLAEFRRLLAATGQVFLTAFVEEGVPDFVENPHGYRTKWTGALHCIRYEKRFLESLVREAGFEVRAFEYGQETDGQSALYLCRASQG
jgi:SAM-dependent methyltransferase